ncbi:phosphopyruvate hydratase [Saguinus oedipus]|uniref:phosphopyruvate hydratase n=1 Tax=Saguinus oedipus TaxID=9490 RepID=A0ABQ9TTD7_SAGOE|nr:phosphopyruvate hydratase [Saguinus oedipus]
MDTGASKFNRFGKYDLDFKSSDDSSRYISSDKLNDLHKFFINDYPVVSIENPFDQNDWGAWQKFTAIAGIQVVGDNLTVTNPKRIATATGSVTESLQSCKLARANGWGVMVLHHSGETEHTIVACLAVAMCTGQTKMCAPCQ